MANKKSVIAAAIIIVLIVGTAVFYLGNSYNKSPSSAKSGGSPSGQVTSNSTATLFSSSRYAPVSYLLSGNTTGLSGQTATSDFNLSVTQQSAAALYTLTFKDTGAVYNVTVPSGDKLYYIDQNVADDSPSSDHYASDDGYAVVNANGYIVTLLYPLPNA